MLICYNSNGEKMKHNLIINKDTAFTFAERVKLGLLGKLPPKIETIEEQAARCYAQYQSEPSNLAKYIYLDDLHNRNEVLFYKLVSTHLEEMLPIIYTPTVGEAIQEYSHIYRGQRGLIISYPDKDYMEKFFSSYENAAIDLIVVSDAERILGIGDQGVGGIYICIGKLAVYTLCGHINPARVLPIQLDVGTDNEEMLNDPMYLGWRHKRMRGKNYDEFIDGFVNAVRKKFPNVLLHWEDFGRDTARANLERYQGQMCTFNDDMQGTGIITLATVLSATLALQQKLTDQKFVFFGAGTAATGIADQICDAMVRQGLSIEEARGRVWMIDKQGLITDDYPNLTKAQKIYARPREEIFGNLLDVIKHVHPTFLIGCSAVSGAFTKEIIKEMAKHTARPVIMPLSNPTAKAEAIPADLFKWTNNKALVATGSPFAGVAQCNNAFAFPGLGLGIIAVQARRVTNNMLWAACQAIVSLSPVNKNKSAPLLPKITDAPDVSYHVALAVAQQAIADGVAKKTDAAKKIRNIMWQPNY